MSSPEPTLPSTELSPVLAPASEASVAAVEASAQRLSRMVRTDSLDSPSVPSPPALLGTELEEPLGAPLAQLLHTRLASSLPPELQHELATLLSLLPAVLSSLGPTERELLRTAAQALTADPPNLEYARRIRSELARSVRQKTALLRLPNLASRSPSALVVMGLGFFAYVVIPLLVFRVAPWLASERDADSWRLLGLPALELLLVCVAGALGSVTSIMIRVREFDARQGLGPVDLMIFGFFKPFIGMFFGLFCYAVFHSDLLPVITLTQGKEHFFDFAVSFLAGFSERFARDLATRAEPGPHLPSASPPAPS